MTGTRKKRAALNSAETIKQRKRLIQWAEMMELMKEFREHFYARVDNGVFDETSEHNIEQAMRVLGSELCAGVPVEW